MSVIHPNTNGNRKNLIKNDQGLTILEVLIAATLMAMMGISIVNITNNSIETKEKVLGEDKVLLQVETAMNILQRDFSQIYSPLFFDEKKKPTRGGPNPGSTYESNERFTGVSEKHGQPIPLFQAMEKHVFEFYSNGNRRRLSDSKESNFQWVRYALRPAGNTFELVRSTMAGNPYSPEAETLRTNRDFVLMKNLMQFQFFFWNPKDKKFVESLENVPGGKSLLKAIKVKFTWLDAGNNPIDEERVFYTSWPSFEEEKRPVPPPF